MSDMETPQAQDELSVDELDAVAGGIIAEPVETNNCNCTVNNCSAT